MSLTADPPPIVLCGCTLSADEQGHKGPHLQPDADTGVLGFFSPRDADGVRGLVKPGTVDAVESSGGGGERDGCGGGGGDPSMTGNPWYFLLTPAGTYFPEVSLRSLGRKEGTAGET